MSKTSRPAYIPELPKWHSSMARQSRLNLGLADEISSVLAVYPWWTRRTWSVPDGPGLSLMDQMHLACPWRTRSVPDGADGPGLSVMDPSPLSAGPGGYGDGHKPGSAVTDRLSPLQVPRRQRPGSAQQGRAQASGSIGEGWKSCLWRESLSSNLHARARTPPPPQTHTHTHTHTHTRMYINRSSICSRQCTLLPR